MKTKEQVSLDRQSYDERKNVNVNVCSESKKRRMEGREGEKWAMFFFFSLSFFHALCPASENQQLVSAAVEQGTCLGFFVSSMSRSW